MMFGMFNMSVKMYDTLKFLLLIIYTVEQKIFAM